MNYKDYYQILGISKSADQKEIKAAYKTLAMKYHPDRNQGNTEAERRFKEISEAYAVLGDPEKRKRYDKLGANWESYQHSGNGGFDWSGYGGKSPFGDSGSFHFEGDPESFFGGNSGFSDFFEQFFGQGFSSAFEGGRARGRTSGYSARGRDIRAELFISLEDAFQGTSKTFELSGERLRIRIKAGAYDGQQLRIKGKGHPAHNGTPRGDLYLTLRLQEHPIFKRENDDLILEKNIDLYTAVLGGKVKLPTLSGDLSINIPKGTASGKLFRLRGKGMPRANAKGQFGDLLVKIQVDIPTDLSAKEEELFVSLRKLFHNKK
jgi:curved DNA-binding protein